MPSDRVFVDSNVFGYLFDARYPTKRDRAGEVLTERAGEVVVSTQVLLEVHSLCTRKLDMTREQAASAVARVAAYPVQATDREMTLEACRLAVRAQLSIFDAAILVAAKRAGASEILSEDLNPGQDYDGVRVVNPFA